MFGLFLSLALLGLLSIDIIGLAAMPMLLSQDKPISRSLLFLAGSLTSLLIIGLLLSKGFGIILLKFDYSYSLVISVISIVGGLILIGLALVLWRRSRNGQAPIGLPESVVKRLQLNNWQLFITGILLVATQSIIDVVFVVAMIRLSQFQLSFLVQLLAVATYSVAAILLQLSIILAFALTTERQRLKFLNLIHRLLNDYATSFLLIVSFLLGFILLIFGITYQH